MFKLMAYFYFNEKTFLLHLVASGHRHKISLSVNKFCMACLYFQRNFVFLQISLKSSHINFSMIFQFILFKKIKVNINTGVIVMFLKPVIIHCCVMFDQTKNTVDEPVQRQHLTLTFTYTENVIRLVLFIVLLSPPKI